MANFKNNLSSSLLALRLVVCSVGEPLSGIKPTSGTPLMGHSGKGSSVWFPAVRFDLDSAHPDEQQFNTSHQVHSPLIGGARVRGAWHALASVVMVAGWSVVFSSCSTSVCLSSPQFPFPILSPLLFSTQSYDCFSVSPLTLMCWCFSPGHFVSLAGNDRTSTGVWLATAQPTGEPGRCVALSAAWRTCRIVENQAATDTEKLSSQEEKEEEEKEQTGNK
ncbi:unnamed protein product [Leuciscus chuanchicus]